MASLFHPSVVSVSIASITPDGAVTEDDEVSVEEPLEILVTVGSGNQRIRRTLAVTMRTPGADLELAAGFLLTEGIIRRREDIADIRGETANAVHVALSPLTLIDFSRLARNSFVSSSCGVCGKRSIAAVHTLQKHRLPSGRPRVRSDVIHNLAAAQRRAQPTFDRTGGLHAAALFDASGQLKSLYEDVGRHNAVDKLIGAELLAGRMPLEDRLLFLSGRAGFELIQKGAIAGIPIVAAVGAPSSLAVSLARQCGMTLLGFVRDHRFNVYADAGRLLADRGGSYGVEIATAS